MIGIDRYWFLTWTTYGQWLPGDPRGCVTRVRDQTASHRVEHDLPGTPYDADLPGLYASAQKLLKGPPVRLESVDAAILLPQFQETAAHRQWLPAAVAIMANHVHLAVGVPGDPDPASILRDFKSYGSRDLNRQRPKPISGTWWTESGSKRKLKEEASVLGAIAYIRRQEFPLLIWIHPIYEHRLQ